MELSTLWFVLVAVLWTGYLVLEGFDFGVGMLTRGLARDERERGLLVEVVGPVWDGNEVWLIAAVGATFAAFPEWYATTWSAYYLPLVVILLALVARAVAFEYRGKGDTAAWRRRWDLVIFAGSLVPAFAWGVVLAGFVQGLPLYAGHDLVGGPGALLTPFALMGGLVTLLLSLVHGAHFVALKTLGEVRDRARRLAVWLVLPVAVVTVVFLVWTLTRREGVPLGGLALVAAAASVAALVAAFVAGRRGREGWAFAATFAAVASTAAALFTSLYPDVLPSMRTVAGGLTVAGAASSDYTLGVMAWVAVPVVPLVLAYQGWVYWTFRRRLGVGRLGGHT